MMDGVNELVKEMLKTFGCLDYAKYFEGLDKSAFLKLSLEDLRETLTEAEDGMIIALKISDQLLRFSRLATEDAAATAGTGPKYGSRILPNNPSIALAMPAETTTSSKHSEHNSLNIEQPPDGEDVKPELGSDGQIVRSQIKQESCPDSESESDYESFMPPQPAAAPSVEEINLESDSETADSATVSPGYSLRTRPNSHIYVLSESSSDDSIADPDFTDSDGPKQKRSKSSKDSGPRRKPKTPLIIGNPTPTLKSLRRSRSFIAKCSYVKITSNHVRDDDTDSIEYSDEYSDEYDMDPDHTPESELQTWADFYQLVGPHIYFLDLEVWSWRAPDSKCPFNLPKILLSLHNLRELRIKTLPKSLESVPFPRKSLPNLVKLSLNHSGKIAYQGQLKSILKAASNLQSFECSFHNLEEASQILELLRAVPSLKSLTFRSHSKEEYLTREQIAKLSQIPAQNLEELELGDGLWEDVDGDCMERLLQRFSGLKKLKMNGSYLGNSLLKPDILISIPRMPNLEVLDIGGDYKFAPLYQSEWEEWEEDNRVITVGDELKTEPFSVTLKLPLLPRLQKLVLGNLFKIDELHFSSFPALGTFRVGSPWHLTVKFPENARKSSYQLITSLQLPDCLRDPSFVQKIPQRFPNLIKCWIFLPSVKVLRTFFKSMAESRLKNLYLKTQYDFEATMELCFLNEPSKAVEEFRDSNKDFGKLRKLEEYGKFQEFVQFYNVELPPKTKEDVRELLEDETCAGIWALKNLKVLEMEHIPRVLRIPKGNLHWTHKDAEFTHGYIGLRKFPLSGNCLRTLRKQTAASWSNMDVDLSDEEEGESLRKLGLKFREGRTEAGSDSDETAFTHSASSSKTRKGGSVARRGIAIQPATLQASIQFREKKEQD